ncbi:TlpA family protein disulfide reductase [Sphingobacterium kyonggiense]
MIFIFVLLVPIFSQQNPALQKRIEPLIIGQKVPEEFWKKEHLFFIEGDTIRSNLSKYKNKVIILDFWASWCGACLENFSKLDALKREFGNEIIVLLVNPKKYRDNLDKINQVNKGLNPVIDQKSLESIILDEYLIELFPHLGIPHYAWINGNGRFTTLTDTGGLVSESIRYQIKNPY